MRLDKYLTENKLAESREKAQQLVEKGAVSVNGIPVFKASYVVKEQDQISAELNALRYVSRGGYKLEKALSQFTINVKGLRILDAGASTGGFTDCLLQAGAQLVYAVDVGSHQLHHSLIHHTKVRSFENKDIRMLDISELDNQPVDLIVADLSFISITRVIDSFLRLSTLDADWILLIKPQFETGKKKNYKKGIIKRTDEREQIIEPVIQAFLEQGLVVKEVLATASQADKKNVEYLVWIQRKI